MSCFAVAKLQAVPLSEGRALIAWPQHVWSREIVQLSSSLRPLANIHTLESWQWKAICL